MWPSGDQRHLVASPGQYAAEVSTYASGAHYSYIHGGHLYDIDGLDQAPSR